jgi:uncharacterized damage-inducible protein DinB
MTSILRQQYALIQSSREVMLSFIDTVVGEDLNAPVPAFENKTIRYLLVHTANTYLHWLSYFALKQQVTFADDRELTTIELVRPIYIQADEAVDYFLNHFAQTPDAMVAGTLSRSRQVSTAPLQLFTHIITHEFHHKGQIMTMCRLLGYTPPDTDVIRT